MNLEVTAADRARTARSQIVSGALRGPALFDLLLSVPPADRDVFTDQLLGLEEPPPDISELPRGAVPYLPCGVEEILATVRELPLLPGDTLVDLGSGLGRVAILAHLLSGAHAHGIEIQEPLVERARALAAALSLPAVTFLHRNAADAPLDGSVFFLYSPFNGETLTRVLRSLEELARKRPITLCAVGLELPGVSWLTPRRTSSASLTLYHSIPQGNVS